MSTSSAASGTPEPAPPPAGAPPACEPPVDRKPERRLSWLLLALCLLVALLWTALERQHERSVLRGDGALVQERLRQLSSGRR